VIHTDKSITGSHKNLDVGGTHTVVDMLNYNNEFSY